MKKMTSLLLICILSVSMSFTSLAFDNNQAASDGLSDNSATLYNTDFSSAAFAAAGTTYGPWFGGVKNQSWSNRPSTVMKVSAVLLGGVSPLLGSTVAAGLCSGAATAIGFTNFDAREYVYGKVSKTYREVYVNGRFSYYQTKATISVSSSKRGYLTTYTKTFNGSMMMGLPDENNIQ